MITGITLDHVALAAEHQTDLWPRYAGDLAGRFMGGGWTVGFAPAQIEYGNGMRLEVLEPHQVDQNDFLRRFLDRNGPGPHHVTYKVKDIAAALQEVEAAGLQPTAVDLRDPSWKEAFLHPKQACGIVVQLAQAAGEFPPEFREMPPPRVNQPASLDHVAHGVPSIDEASQLFVSLLGGEEVASGGGWVELAWPGSGRIRLVERDGDPRVSHLAFTVAEPEGIADARPDEDGTWVVDAENNFGTRLVVRAPG